LRKISLSRFSVVMDENPPRKKVYTKSPKYHKAFTRYQ